METPKVNPQAKRKAIRILKDKTLNKRIYVDSNQPNQTTETTVKQDKSGEVISGAKGYSIMGSLTTYNPDDLLLRKGQNVAFYEKMHKDDKLSGIHDFKTKAVLAVDWEIKPADKSAEAIKYRDFVKEQFDQMTIPFTDVLRNYFDSWYQGYKIGEKVWEARDAFWWIKCIKCKPSNWFLFQIDEFHNLKGIKLVSDNSQIDLNKVILYVHPYLKDGNWYGTSDYNSIYREWWSKDTMIKLGNVAVEAYADPIRKVLYDFQNMTADQISDMESAVDNFHDNYAIYIPAMRKEEDGTLLPLFDLTFLETSKKPGDEFKAKVEEYNTAMARRLLIGDKLGYTDSPNGAYALGKIQFDLLMSVIMDIHRRVEDTFNPQLIGDIMMTNFPTVSVGLYPKLKFAEIEEGVTAEKVKIVKDAIDAGLVNPLEEWVRPYLRFPEKDPNIELPKPKSQQPNPFAPQNLKKFSKKDILSRVDFKQMEKDLDEVEQKTVNKTTKTYEAMRVDAMAQASKVSDSGAVKTGDIGFKQEYYTLMGSALETGLSKAYMDGRKTASIEIKKAEQKNFIYKPFLPDILLEGNMKGYLDKYGKALDKKDSEAFKKIKQMALHYVDGNINKITAEIEDILLKNVGKLSTGEIKELVSSVFDDYLETGSVDGSSPEPYRVNTLVRTESTRFFNEGRMTTFLDPDLDGFVQGLMYSAIMDDRTTDFCAEHDGQIIEATDPLAQLIPPAHYNCRSTWAPVFRGEDYTLDWDYNTVPAEGFGGE